MHLSYITPLCQQSLTKNMAYGKENKRSLSFSILISCVTLSLLGLALATLLPIKLSPENASSKLEIAFTASDMSPRLIETSVTSKIEAICSRIEGVSEITSKSQRGKGSVTLTLDSRANLDRSRFETSVALRQIWGQLPASVSYPQVRMINSEGTTARPFIIYGINASNTADAIEKATNDIVIPEIGAIPGVAYCTVTGSTQEIWKIECADGTLSSLNLSHAHIEKSLREELKTNYLGNADLSGTMRQVIVEPFPKQDDTYSPNISWISMAGDSTQIAGSRLLKSHKEEESPNEIFRVNGRSMVYCLIYPEKSANQLRLSSEIDRGMGTALNRLPSGYHIDKIYDSAALISEELQTLLLRTGLTIVILLLFVAITTKSVKYALLVSISLFFNISIAFILYYALKIEIQLYTLAAITISLNIIIDNIIVMAEHMIRKNDRSVFTSILTASLTTIGALVIVFFLEEDVRITLEHFTIVIMVNLLVSLFVALFVIPALIEKMNIEPRPQRRGGSRNYVASYYVKLINWLLPHKLVCFVILIFLFGTPIFMLPKKIDGESWFANIYNSTIGSELYTYRIRPIVDAATGGALRLFAENVYYGEYQDNDNGEPVLSVLLTMPSEVDIFMTEETISELESHLASYEAVHQVQTSIYPQRAVVNVFFTKGLSKGAAVAIKENVTAYVQTLGAGTWHVSGVNEENFTNSVRQLSGSIKVRVAGYNYQTLEALVSVLQDSIMKYRRFQMPSISAEPVKWKEVKQEYQYASNRDAYLDCGITNAEVISVAHSHTSDDAVLGSIDGHKVVLQSSSSIPTEWELENHPFVVNGRDVKLGLTGKFALKNTPSEIVKKNQEYQLYLQVDYIGDESVGTDKIDDIISGMKKNLPMGFSVEREPSATPFKLRGSDWSLLLLAIGVIFFITSILFGNLRQSIGIILTIPISYIGLFLTFDIIGAKIDQGALAAFVLLSGLIVNMAIYIIDTMNELSVSYPERAKDKLFVQAFAIKGKSIFLTISSTVLGFCPFLFGINHESFWYTLALGTIGGLVVGFLGVVVFLPLFIIKRKKAQDRPPIHKNNSPNLIPMDGAVSHKFS